ncbi:hypothetical protein KV692_00960 [Xanthomonas euvesicatoria pv. physalidis]|uniref:hypothetical protein n=2 Tax=Xanthomonas euvesicatoria TaxID=456327 RepID=UPI001C481E49|nr:hypothetical protein [Xanthomonas euvesicatoria]MBV6686479.1 hypothetical protein [Xanthomonas euvesicatoria pv. physalidis]MBV6791986.1 hypothetical protein [Xanthomonas campestris pv. daturae]
MSTATLAGVISGMGSHACDTLLIPSMDRRARVANLPRFQAIDPKILVPDPPPVLLEITPEGSKRFVRPGENGTPTRAELTAQAYDRRAGIAQRQSVLDDTALDTMLLRPTISGGFNAARRTSGTPPPVRRLPKLAWPGWRWVVQALCTRRCWTPARQWGALAR